MYNIAHPIESTNKTEKNNDFIALSSTIGYKCWDGRLKEIRREIGKNIDGKLVSYFLCHDTGGKAVLQYQ